MKNLFTSWKTVAIVAISIMTLSACKKENLKEKLGKQSQSQPVEASGYKYSSVVKIQGATTESGYLQMTVSSDDENYLKTYVTQLEKSTITFIEADLSKENEGGSNALIEGESEAGVSLNFDWSNFHFDLEKGKLYGVYLAAKGQGNSKSLVLLYSYNNVTSFTNSSGYAAVNVNSTQPGFQFGCLCTTQSKWKFTNIEGFNLYEKLMSKGDNLEIVTFSCNFTGCYYDNYGISPITYYGGNPVYYNPRFNYSGAVIPAASIVYNHIKTGTGINTYTNSVSEKATVTFYIAG